MGRGLILFLISMCSLGVGIPIAGMMMESFPLYLFNFITVLISAIVLIPIATIVEKTSWSKLGLKNYIGLFVQALLSITLYTTFTLYGLIYASPIAVGIVTSITPAVVAILAFFLLREKLNVRKGIAILLAIVAVLIMQTSGAGAEGGSNSGVGIIFMLLAVLSLALFFILAKKFSVNLPPLTLSAGFLFFGAIQTFPMALIDFLSIDKAVFNESSTWWGIILYAFTGYIIAYIFTFLGISRIHASTAGMATAAIPIVATIVAVLFFGAGIRTVDVIALIIVIISIFIAEFQKRKEDLPMNTPTNYQQ